MRRKKMVLVAAMAGALVTLRASGQTLGPVEAREGSTALNLLTLAAPAESAISPDNPDDWRFRLALPLWLAGIDGTMVVRGQELQTNQGTGDVVDALSSHLNFAGAFHFEAEKSRLGIFVDAMYLDLRAEKDTRRETTEASVKEFLGELGGFYTVIAPKPEERGWGTFRADALAGVRVTWLQLGLDTPRFNENRDKSIVDPFVGARMELGLTDWLSYKLRGDIGGFGVGSDLAWNVDTAFEFHISKGFDINLGYRWLDYDIKSGSGSDRFEFDVTLSGPYVALQFRF